MGKNGERKHTMPITGDVFDSGASGDHALGEVMEADTGYDTKEVSVLIGKSWGIAKKRLVAAQAEGKVDMKKIGRKHYWRYYAGGVPGFVASEVDTEIDEELEPDN